MQRTPRFEGKPPLPPGRMNLLFLILAWCSAGLGTWSLILIPRCHDLELMLPFFVCCFGVPLSAIGGVWALVQGRKALGPSRGAAALALVGLALPGIAFVNLLIVGS